MLISHFSWECRVQESHLSRENPWIQMRQSKRLENRLLTAHWETFHLFPPPCLIPLINFLFSWRSPSDSDVQQYIMVTHSHPLSHDLNIIPHLHLRCVSASCVFLMEWVSEYGVYPQRYTWKYLLDLSRGRMLATERAGTGICSCSKCTACLCSELQFDGLKVQCRRCGCNTATTPTIPPFQGASEESTAAARKRESFFFRVSASTNIFPVSCTVASERNEPNYQNKTVNAQQRHKIQTWHTRMARMRTPNGSRYMLALQLTFLHGVVKPNAAVHSHCSCALTRVYTHSEPNRHRFYTHLCANIQTRLTWTCLVGREEDYLCSDG